MHLLPWKSDGEAEGRPFVHIEDINDNRIIEDNKWAEGVNYEVDNGNYYLLKEDGSRNTHIPCAHVSFPSIDDPVLARDLRSSIGLVDANDRSRFKIINNFQDIYDNADDGWIPHRPFEDLE